MNCYEWRKRITGSVSVAFNYLETGPGYTLAGSGTITHAALYTGWTHRELQCIGTPLGDEPNWILRGDNLCEGRAQIFGILTPENTIPVTYTPTVGTPSTEQWSIFWQVQPEGYDTRTNLLPVSPYPDWENDPYSVSYRAAIDASPPGTMLVGIAPTPPDSGFPAVNGVPIRWLKNGENGTSDNGFLTASVSCIFSLA